MWLWRWYRAGGGGGGGGGGGSGAGIGFHWWTGSGLHILFTVGIVMVTNAYIPKPHNMLNFTGLQF